MLREFQSLFGRVNCLTRRNKFCKNYRNKIRKSYIVIHKRAASTASKPHGEVVHSKEVEDMSLIRNIGILAHIDAGKTTTTERMLYYSGFSNYLGEVHHGDTVMDYMQQERDRGITISSAAITLHWNKHKINLIDTPGHVDFTVEVERCLRVLDGAVVVLDSSAGVEAQTKTVWKQADKYNIPRIVYLNKMDKRGATVEKCLKSLQEKLKIDPLLVHLPLGRENEFTGIVDLITLEKLVWSSQHSPDGQKFSVDKLDSSEDSVILEDVSNARTTLIGKLSEHNEEIEDLILKDVNILDIPSAVINKAIRNATIGHKLVPVLCGSSLKNKGVQPLMDAVNHFLPSPMDITYSFADFYGSDLCALAFKIIHDKQRGALTFLRLYAGSLKSGASVFNINKNCMEKPSRLIHVYANEYHDITMATAGNIVCVSGLKETITGDTITNSKATALEATKQYRKTLKKKSDAEEDKVPMALLAGLEIPAPVFFCSIEPPSLAAQKDLDHALLCLQREDPSLTVEINSETGQTVLSGMGELHMEITKQRILEEYKIDAEIGELQVAYKETISENTELEEVLDKTIGDKRHHVTMKLSVESDTSAPHFKHVILSPTREDTLEHVRRPQMVSVENGVKSALMCGTLINFPVINVGVKLHSLHIGKGTSPAMVSACASQCIHRLLKQSNPVLLEPMMALTITTDEDRLHSVLGDLSQRRSHIQNVTATNEDKVVESLTPLSELMGYSTKLRTITSGTAAFSMQFSHYEKMSVHDQNLAIEKITGFMPLS